MLLVLGLVQLTDKTSVDSASAGLSKMDRKIIVHYRIALIFLFLFSLVVAVVKYAPFFYNLDFD